MSMFFEQFTEFSGDLSGFHRNNGTLKQFATWSHWNDEKGEWKCCSICCTGSKWPVLIAELQTMLAKVMLLLLKQWGDKFTSHPSKQGRVWRSVCVCEKLRVLLNPIEGLTPKQRQWLSRASQHRQFNGKYKKHGTSSNQIRNCHHRFATTKTASLDRIYSWKGNIFHNPKMHKIQWG